MECILKMTGVELDLLNDIDRLLMIESGLRGGISTCVTRHSKANNKYMHNYDPNKQSKFITI